MSARAKTDDARLTEALAPEPALRAWIGERLPGQGAFEVRRVTRGMSNELFRLRREGGSAVLRRPPRVRLAAVSERSLEREFRVLQALESTSVPHPRPIALCTDLEVIGAPFLLMEEIVGVQLYDQSHGDYATDPEARYRLGFDLIGCLAALHNIDWEAAGLTGFGRPEGFTDRQVERWLTQLMSFGVRDFRRLAMPARWLGDNAPPMQHPSLIHGDFGLHNVLMPPKPGPVAAVLDWETSTVGDPLMDAGYFLSMWLSEAEKKRWAASGLPYDVTGFASRAELTEAYADLTGLDVSGLYWYQAVAQLKMAAMLEGGYARYIRGDADGIAFASLGKDVLNHIDYALHLIDRAKWPH